MSYITGNPTCGLVDLRDIFGAPDRSLQSPDGPPDEHYRCLLLDPALCPALRGGTAARARLPTRRVARARYCPPLVAGLTARPARRSEAGDDGEPGDRSLSVAAVVRARPSLLRRAVRAAAGRAERGEPGGRAGGAGAGLRGDRRIGGAVRCAGRNRRGDQTRNAERGTRNRGWKIARLFRVPGGVGEGQVRLLGRRYARATGGSRDRPPGGGGAVSLRPTTRRPPARSRHAPPAAPARAQDSRPARRVAGGSGRLAVRRCRPQAVAARGGGGSRAGRGP